MRVSPGQFLVAAALLLGAAPAATAEPTQGADLPLSPERVIASLKRTVAWYQGAKAVMRSVNQAAGPVFAQEDEQTVVRLLQRAFDTARRRPRS
jgi:hypothetical protein